MYWCGSGRYLTPAANWRCRNLLMVASILREGGPATAQLSCIATPVQPYWTGITIVLILVGCVRGGRS